VIDAIAFDLDGTLIASEQRWEAARRAVTEESGGRWREDAQPTMMGLSTAEWTSYMRRELEIPLGGEEIVDRVMAQLERSYREDLPLIEGALDAVERLGARWPLAIASSSPRSLIELVLGLAGVRNAFDVVISSAEVARGKPSPDVFLRACELLGSRPAATPAIEDSGAGVFAARAAGMPVVLIPGTEFPPKPEVLDEADVVLGSLAELTVERVESLG